MKTINFTNDVAGTPVYSEVSPCSWMYPDYGLQIGVRLNVNYPNIATHFLFDKTLPYAKATEADARKMIKDFLDAGGMEILKAAEAKWQALQQKMVVSEAERAKKLAAEDKEAKRKGYTHKLVAWVHPASGDDYMVSAYAKPAPTDAMVKAMLKRRKSTVLTDYKIVEL